MKLFNTLTRKKEELKPITPGHVQFYSCGQTVYDDVHVGNAKTFIIWDLLARTLRHLGYQVKHIQNFTDVGHLTDDGDQGEDKIVKRARELGYGVISECLAYGTPIAFLKRSNFPEEDYLVNSVGEYQLGEELFPDSSIDTWVSTIRQLTTSNVQSQMPRNDEIANTIIQRYYEFNGKQ